MAIYGSNIIYNGVSSEDFGLILASFDIAAQRQSQLGLTREIISDSSARGQRSNIYGTKYNSTLSFDMTLIKRNGDYMTDMDIRGINKWLIGYQYPKKLIIINDEREVQNTYFNCLITNVMQENVVGVAGLTFTVICDAPYAWEDFNETYKIIEQNQLIQFYNISDENDEYLYPNVKITMDESNNLTIKNVKDLNNTITLTGLKLGEVVTLDCENEIIKSTSRTFTSTLGGQDNFSHTWLRLLSGLNEFTVNGNCSLEIYGSYPRKVGV